MIRISDEKRAQKDEHLQKLKNFILSEECFSHHEELVQDIFPKCVLNMPHKSLIYSTLVALIAIEKNSLAVDIVNKLVESLQESFV